MKSSDFLPVNTSGHKSWSFNRAVSSMVISMSGLDPVYFFKRTPSSSSILTGSKSKEKLHVPFSTADILGL